MSTEITPAAEAPPLPVLSRREHRYLWLVSQGHSTEETKHLLGTRAVYEISTRVRRKLGARTTPQAVFIACSLDLIGPYEVCGLPSGYRAHRGRHEDPCRACRRVFTDHAARTARLLEHRPAQLTEPELRLLRAFDAGRTFKQVEENWGLSYSQLCRLRASLYRKLDLLHLPPCSRYQAALDEGRLRGLLLARGRGRAVAPGRVLNPRRWGTTDLTDLQVRILAALVGRSLSEAGELLGLPTPQVSSHLARIYRKLDVLHHAHGERRDAALAVARERGYPV